jgi:hypothetical protein
MPQRLMTPTVRNRGGIIRLNPSRGGFFVAGHQSRRRGDHLQASSARSPGSPELEEDGQVDFPPRSHFVG